jgi:hypothetical protein
MAAKTAGSKALTLQRFNNSSGFGGTGDFLTSKGLLVDPDFAFSSDYLNEGA